jgi:hypothetical protein
MMSLTYSPLLAGASCIERMDTPECEYEVIPNQITASGLRRSEKRIPEDELVASAHGRIKTESDIADDFVDEKALRIRSVEQKLRHQGDHGRKQEGPLSMKAAEHDAKDRRPGYGVECTCAKRASPIGIQARACVCGVDDSSESHRMQDLTGVLLHSAAPAGSARSQARKAVGMYNTHRSFYGGHSKVGSLEHGIAADARQFAEEEAGIHVEEALDEEEETGAPVPLEEEMKKEQTGVKASTTQGEKREE